MAAVERPPARRQPVRAGGAHVRAAHRALRRRELHGGGDRVRADLGHRARLPRRLEGAAARRGAGRAQVARPHRHPRGRRPRRRDPRRRRRLPPPRRRPRGRRHARRVLGRRPPLDGAARRRRRALRGRRVPAAARAGLGAVYCLRHVGADPGAGRQRREALPRRQGAVGRQGAAGERAGEERALVGGAAGAGADRDQAAQGAGREGQARYRLGRPLRLRQGAAFAIGHRREVRARGDAAVQRGRGGRDGVCAHRGDRHRRARGRAARPPRAGAGDRALPLVQRREARGAPAAARLRLPDRPHEDPRRRPPRRPPRPPIEVAPRDAAADRPLGAAAIGGRGVHPPGGVARADPRRRRRQGGEDVCARPRRRVRRRREAGARADRRGVVDRRRQVAAVRRLCAPRRRAIGPARHAPRHRGAREAGRAAAPRVLRSLRHRQVGSDRAQGALARAQRFGPRRRRRRHQVRAREIRQGRARPQGPRRRRLLGAGARPRRLAAAPAGPLERGAGGDRLPAVRHARRGPHRRHRPPPRRRAARSPSRRAGGEGGARPVRRRRRAGGRGAPRPQPRRVHGARARRRRVSGAADGGGARDARPRRVGVPAVRHEQLGLDRRARARGGAAADGDPRAPRAGGDDQVRPGQSSSTAPSSPT